MDYSSFRTRFSGASRTEHIQSRDEAGHPRSQMNGRHWILPATAELPSEFIRLCPWEVEYLFTVARRARLGIIETGRFNGGSLFVMACASPDTVPITSVDIAPQDDSLLTKLLSQLLPGRRIDLIVGDSQHTKYPHVGVADLLFIDGDHSYEGCLADICNWYEKLAVGGHLILHDAYLGTNGVQDAVLDFMQMHPELMVMRSPYIGAQHWHNSAGSLTHLVRR